MRIFIATFTAAGARLCADLSKQLPYPCEGFAPERFCGGNSLKPLNNSVSEWAKAHFKTGDALVFIGAAGIAVRAAAPHLRDKQHDPAVISLDERGNYIIPLLSGHLGGANRLAREIAALTGGIAVISTATDVNGCWAPDLWASENGYAVADIAKIKHISAAVLEGKPVGFDCDFPVSGDLPFAPDDYAKTGICISLEKREKFAQTLWLIPKCLTLGIGCRKHTAPEALEDAVLDLLTEHRFPVESIGAVATVTLKENEPAILEFCDKYRIPMRVYTAEELKAVPGEFSSSQRVLQVTGVDNVCERAAVLAGGGLIVQKTAKNGVTLAVAKQNWRVLF